MPFLYSVNIARRANAPALRSTSCGQAICINSQRRWDKGVLDIHLFRQASTGTLPSTSTLVVNLKPIDLLGKFVVHERLLDILSVSCTSSLRIRRALL